MRALAIFRRCRAPNSVLVLRDLWSYLRIRRKWWLLPMILLIVFLGLILAFAQGSPLAPFIYTVF